MAEAKLINYSFKELAALMVKDQGIHEGIWGIYVKFGINAANVGPTETDVRPTALVPILELGLQKLEELTNISVDAAVENPAPAKKVKSNVTTIAALGLGKAKRKS